MIVIGLFKYSFQLAIESSTKNRSPHKYLEREKPLGRSFLEFVPRPKLAEICKEALVACRLLGMGETGLLFGARSLFVFVMCYKL